MKKTTDGQAMNRRHAPRRRNPTQARAEATLAAIRQACLRIIEREGLSHLTTNRIAEVAGISIGSLYQYYADKHAIAADICNELLLAELDQLGRFDAETLALVKTSLEETLRFFIDEHVARQRRLYRKLRGFYLEIHWHYDFEAYMVEKFPGKLTTTDWLPAALKYHQASLAVRDYSLAATMVTNAIEGSIHATLDRDPELIMSDAFPAELLAMILAYLKHPRVRAGAGESH